MRKQFLFLILCFCFSPSTWACESGHGTVSREAVNARGEDEAVWFGDFSMQQIQWKTMPANEAHRLHHQGHHFHDKTHEEFYNFALGVSPVEKMTLLAELPYVVRGSLDIESHAHLGRHERSEGWGDLALTGIWRFVQEESGVLGWLAGVKLPTGETNELNSDGARFEPELQPGTGSTDKTLGLVGQKSFGPTALRGNVHYTWNGKGDQHFKFGDAMDVHLSAERRLNSPESQFQTMIGLNAEWRVEGRQNDSGVRVEDSGGNVVLLGPSLEVRAAALELFGNILVPAYQNMGGVHQELDFVWNAGAKIQW